ncbi:MAG: tetratricopeptide repeat protein [Chitinivibrionales bacterium]|nr:tetratricopeptide repeat protein [Chitinivibrionales bacterium]
MKISAAIKFVFGTAAIISGIEIEFSPDEISGSDAIPSALVRTAEDAYKLNMRGLDLLESGDVDGARPLFEQAKETLPGYTDAINNLGVVYFRKGQVARAEALWESIIEQDGTYALAFHNLGTLAFYEKKYGQAREYFSRALKVNKTLIDTHVMLGRMALSQGKNQEALRYFGKAYSINSQHKAAWGYYAYGLIQEGDTSQAVRVLKENPLNPDALDMLGTVGAVRGDLQASAGYFRRAAEAGARSPVFLKLASVYLDAGKCTEARAAAERYMADTNVPGADAYLTAGISAMECGDEKAAVGFFEEGLDRYPADAFLRYNLGKVYFRVKKFGKAENLLASIKDSLHDPELYYLRALAAHKQKNTARAQALVNKALALDKKARYFDLLGAIHYATGRKEDAKKQFRKALSLNPGLQSAQINLSLVDKSSEDIAEAVRRVEKELKECTENCTGQVLRLSVLFYHSARTEKALRILRQLPAADRDGRVYKTMALYCRDLNDIEGAIELLEKAGSRFGAETATEQELAELYLLAGKYNQAIETLTSLLGKPDNTVWRILYQIGYAYMKQNDLQRAKHYFQKSFDAGGEPVAAQSLLAYVLNKMGDESSAQALWKQSLSKDPENPVLAINMGLAREKQGDYSEALRYYEKARALQKDNETIWINIGNAYAGLKQYSRAFDAYSRALQSEKRETAAFNIFTLARKLKKKDKAAAMLELLKQEFPGADNTHRARGEAALLEGDTVAALTALASLREYNADDHVLLGMIHSARGDNNKAVEHMEKVPDTDLYSKQRKVIAAQTAFTSGNYGRALNLWKELADTSFGIQYNMGMAALKTGQHRLAYDIAGKLAARALAADRADVWRLAGNAALGLENWDKAAKWYSRLAEVIHNDPVVHYNMAVAAYNLGEIDEAWKYYEKARALKPSLKNSDIENRYAAAGEAEKPELMVVIDSLDDLYNEALVLQSQDKTARAEQIYTKIVQADSAHTRAWNNLGAIYAAQGELDKAEKCYLSALDNNHDLPEAYANLANIYLALDKVSDAKRWVFKGLHYHPENELLRQMEHAVDKKMSH